MNRLKEIIEILSSGDAGTTNALLKTKVLLFTIGKKDLASWVDHEINGYPSLIPLPEYRIVGARILASLNNGARSYPNYPLPISYLDDSDYQDANESQVRLSISQIEQLVLNSGNNQFIEQPIPLDIAYVKYCKNVVKGYEITRCYKEIALHNFTAIMTQVRSRLLDFVLELSDQVGELSDDISMTEKLKNVDTSAIFNSSIFGDHTVINLGNDNSFNITNNIAKNDTEALKKALIKEGLSEDDVNELEVAIVADGPIARLKNDYGSSVSEWLTKMITKAATGTIGIGVAATSQLITAALKKYYGL